MNALLLTMTDLRDTLQKAANAGRPARVPCPHCEGTGYRKSNLSGLYLDDFGDRCEACLGSGSILRGGE